MRFIVRFISYFISKIEINSQKINLENIKKILIIKLDEIGDFVLSIPLIKGIKQCNSNISIDLLAKDVVKDLADGIPYLTKRYYLRSDLFGKMKIRKIFLFLYAILYSLLKLKNQKYDLVIVPRWDVDSSLAVLFSFFSFSKYRLTYSEKVSEIKKKYNNSYDKFYTHIIYNIEPKHEVERHIDIIKFLGINNTGYELELYVKKSDTFLVEDMIKIFDNNKIVAICPVASHERKKWLTENYVSLSEKIIKIFNYNIVIIGGNEGIENNDFSKLLNRFSKKVLDLRGRLTLTQTAALLEKCYIYVGNDTGPMHLAAAVKIPIIEIVTHPDTIDYFHPQSPKRFKPWGVKSIVLYPKHTKNPCPPNMCIAEDSHCINNITIEDVFKTFVKLDKLLRNE